MISSMSREQLIKEILTLYDEDRIHFYGTAIPTEEQISRMDAETKAETLRKIAEGYFEPETIREQLEESLQEEPYENLPLIYDMFLRLEEAIKRGEDLERWVEMEEMRVNDTTQNYN